MFVLFCKIKPEKDKSETIEIVTVDGGGNRVQRTGEQETREAWRVAFSK